MSVSVKHLTGFALLLIAVLVSGQAVLSVYQMAKLENAVDGIETTLPQIRLIGKIDTETTRFRLEVSRRNGTDSLENNYEIDSRIAMSGAAIPALISDLRAHLQDDAARKLGDELARQWSSASPGQTMS